MTVRTIKIDEQTALALQTRARERGVTVADVVADLLAASDTAVSVNEEEIAELDRQWRAIEQGEPTVPHTEVADWLRTWGTPAFRPWRDR